jgi:uncharacterized small protein (DUF1192 family)
MIKGHAYDMQTGELSAEQYGGTTLDLAVELLPPGTGFIAGSFDHLRHRVNLQTGEVEQWESPLLATIERANAERAALRKRGSLLARMVEIDRQKIRPMSALLVDPANEVERARLAALDAELELLRAQLNQPPAAP